jgi:hypothetical protein
MVMRRGDRKTWPEAQAEPVLLGDRADLESQLGQRLDQGHELASRAVASHEEMRKLRADFYAWDEDIEQLLRSRFSTAKIAQEYKRVIFGTGNAPNPAIELTWLQEDISTQVRKLESIHRKLDLFGQATA